MGSYTVIGRPLVLNDRRRKIGAKVEMGDRDADILVRAGRLGPYEARQKPASKATGRKRRRRARPKAAAGG
jgi:hypothetical protein